MPAVLTDLNQMVQRRIANVATDFTSTLVIAFDDDCYIVLQADWDRDGLNGIGAVSPDPTTEHLLVEAGVMTKEEHERLCRDREQRIIGNAKQDRYREYLRLQKEFGGLG